jgi:hypothetical protein
MTLQQGNSKNKVLFIGVPIISVPSKFYTHNQQVFMGKPFSLIFYASVLLKLKKIIIRA